jgi:hypothetical protein
MIPQNHPLDSLKTLKMGPACHDSSTLFAVKHNAALDSPDQGLK